MRTIYIPQSKRKSIDLILINTNKHALRSKAAIARPSFEYLYYTAQHENNLLDFQAIPSQHFVLNSTTDGEKKKCIVRFM